MGGGDTGSVVMKRRNTNEAVCTGSTAKTPTEPNSQPKRRGKRKWEQPNKRGRVFYFVQWTKMGMVGIYGMDSLGNLEETIIATCVCT